MSFTPLPQQLRAIEAPMGPVLVVAGPGAGKTFCLIARIQHLIASGIDPHRICAVTFTNRAAEEIALRRAEHFLFVLVEIDRLRQQLVGELPGWDGDAAATESPEIDDPAGTVLAPAHFRHHAFLLSRRGFSRGSAIATAFGTGTWSISQRFTVPRCTSSLAASCAWVRPSRLRARRSCCPVTIRIKHFANALVNPCLPVTGLPAEEVLASHPVGAAELPRWQVAPADQLVQVALAEASTEGHFPDLQVLGFNLD